MDLLLGRDNHVARLVEILNTPGQHALLFGDRGVGKSSLANIVHAVVETEGYFKEMNIFFKTCSSEDTFLSILSAPLKSIGIDVSLIETSHAHTEKGSAGASAYVFKAGVESSRQNTEKKQTSLKVSNVADSLKKISGLLIIDEADAVSLSEEKRKIAELIKLLSDAGSPFKLMVVGIAETGSELIAGHASVQRCLGQVKIERLKDPELWQIIALGQTKISSPHRLEFDSEVINSIVEISNGYPYFTHLLALKCAEEAIVSSRSSVRKEDLRLATEAAAEAAEGALLNTYNEAIRSASQSNRDKYKIILLAAAKMKNHEFTTKEWREAISKVSGQEITHSQIKNYSKTLLSDGASTILRRKGRGVYCFNDPRFPSFIRIVHSDI